MRTRGLVGGLTAVVVCIGVGFLWMELTRPVASSSVTQGLPSSSRSNVATLSGAATERPKATPTTRRRARKPALPKNPDASAFEAAMTRFQSRIARCLEADAPRKLDTREQPLLLLDVQFHGGNLEIVDAAFQKRGGISSGTADCVVGALRGEAIPSSVGFDEEGSRMTIPFPLQQLGV